MGAAGESGYRVADIGRRRMQGGDERSRGGRRGAGTFSRVRWCPPPLVQACGAGGCWVVAGQETRGGGCSGGLAEARGQAEGLVVYPGVRERNRGGGFSRVRWLVLAALPASAEGGMNRNDTAAGAGLLGGRGAVWWFTGGVREGNRSGTSWPSYGERGSGRGV